jgi:hypothetical protein
MEKFLSFLALISFLFFILSILNGINVLIHFIIYDNKIKELKNLNTEDFLEKEDEIFKVVDNKYSSFCGNFLLMAIFMTIFYILKYAENSNIF